MRKKHRNRRSGFVEDIVVDDKYVQTMKDKKIDSTAYCAPVIVDFNDFASERNPAQECEIQLKIDTAIQNFNKVSNNQNVLFVHCAMGMSRSASCVIMYIMKKFKIGFEQVFEFV